jgi:hypothetical protein
MQHPDERRAGERAQRRLLFWLAVVALLNIAFYLLISVADGTKGVNLLSSGRNGVRIGQIIVLGALAALLPRRALVGLAIIILISPAYGGIFWLRLRQTADSSFIWFSYLAIIQQALLVQAATWGLRIALGWRVTASPFNNEPFGNEQLRGQFQIVDLAEWTTLIAVVLGLHTIVVGHRLDLTMALIYLADICGWLLIGLPLIRAILARRPSTALLFALLTIWPLPVAMASAYAIIKIQHLGISTFYLFFWPALVPSTIGMVITIALNASALRYLGYRWRSSAPMKHHVRPSALQPAD